VSVLPPQATKQKIHNTAKIVKNSFFMFFQDVSGKLSAVSEICQQSLTAYAFD
jgi:hypothetical protein